MAITSLETLKPSRSKFYHFLLSPPPLRTTLPIVKVCDLDNRLLLHCLKTEESETMLWYLSLSLLSQILIIHGLIVPDEVPTILSVIYSNIPVIKKGTDSRFGWGFRLGNRADFQVLTELGPQIYTQPLGNQGENNANKRNTIDSLSNTLYAQRNEEKKSEGARWLHSWSENVKDTTQKVPHGALPGLAEGEIDAKSVLPADPSKPDEGVLKVMEMIKRLQQVQQQKRKILDRNTKE